LFTLATILRCKLIERTTEESSTATFALASPNPRIPKVSGGVILIYVISSEDPIAAGSLAGGLLGSSILEYRLNEVC